MGCNSINLNSIAHIHKVTVVVYNNSLATTKNDEYDDNADKDDDRDKN